jgi:hypothetical protein
VRLLARFGRNDERGQIRIDDLLLRVPEHPDELPVCPHATTTPINEHYGVWHMLEKFVQNCPGSDLCFALSLRRNFQLM